MTDNFEDHPYNTSEDIPEGTRTLVVGTAPPPHFSVPRSKGGRREKWDFDFFYGSEANLMWVPFFTNIAKNRFKEDMFTDEMSSDECCEIARVFLKRRELWMRDVLQRFQRNKPTAKDADIVPPDVSGCTDFRPIFAANPRLNKIAFTSDVAAKWTFKKMEYEGLVQIGSYLEANAKRRVPQEAPLEEYIQVKFLRPLLKTTILGRSIDFFVLPSPTRRVPKAGLTIERKQEIYEKILFPV